MIQRAVVLLAVCVAARGEYHLSRWYDPGGSGTYAGCRIGISGSLRLPQTLEALNFQTDCRSQDSRFVTLL